MKRLCAALLISITVAGCVGEEPPPSRVVSCPDPKQERVIVALIAGQSNAANHGEPLKNSPTDNPAILNLLNSRCYLARHPLLGATGNGTSAWIEMSRLLVNSDAAEKVVLVSTAIGGTTVSQWAGEFRPRMVERIQETERIGLPVTHFLWHQGERDARLGTEPENYSRDLAAIIASVRTATGESTPAFIALTTRCSNGPSTPIRAAQQAVADADPITYIGFDSDTLGPAYRYDGCHFTEAGLAKMATGFAEAIRATLLTRDLSRLSRPPTPYWSIQ